MINSSAYNSMTVRNKIRKRKSRELQSENFDKHRSILEKDRMRKRKRIENEKQMRRAEDLESIVDFSEEHQINMQYSPGKPSVDLFWRIINQNYNVKKSLEGLEQLRKEMVKNYNSDVLKFLSEIRNISDCHICAVCGRNADKSEFQFTVNDKIFEPLRIKEARSTIFKANAKEFHSSWNGYYKENDTYVHICSICRANLLKGKIPRLSRTNIPISMPSDLLQDLSRFEQLLISPVIPMIYVYRFHGYGQYQSKGQCVSFENNLQRIVEVLPHKPDDIIVNVSDVYGKGIITIRPFLIREAINELKYKYNHPAYQNISISEENMKNIEDFAIKARQDHKETNEQKQQSPCSQNTSKNICTDTEYDFNEYLRSIGQRQMVEKEIAQNSDLHVTIETQNTSSLKNAIYEIFKSVSKGKASFYKGSSSKDGWAERFPYLLPDGRGGPHGVFIPISLREWISYVIQIPHLGFRNNILFICFSNIYLRRQRIVGLTARKPIIEKVQNAIEKLVCIARENSISTVPESTLRSLIKNISIFVDCIPGSVKDMMEFRRDLISMITQKGPPSYFVTLSAADSMWPETFLEILNGSVSLQESRSLSAKQRLELLAQNPVQVTLAWKKRLKAFLDFVIKGKSKPLGEITHYATKAEWQGRLSEHVHMLFWTREPLPLVRIQEKPNPRVSNRQIHELLENQDLINKVESKVTAFLPGSESVKPTHSLSSLDLFDIIKQDPEELDLPLSDKSRRNLQNLVRACQTHRCSAYCTKNGTRTCKSNFPFALQQRSTLVFFYDDSGNVHFRMRMRRNNENINNYSLPIINFWRANMDIQPLCNKSFGTIVYLAYYTSKTEKYSTVNDIIRKLRESQPETADFVLLRKALLSMECYRPFGAPEAASNLLQYPHRFTSWKTLRIDTRPYLKYLNCDSDTPIMQKESIASLNKVFKTIVNRDERFQINSSEHHGQRSDPIVRNYFLRPDCLEHLSMTQFTEQFVTTKRKSKLEEEYKNQMNYIVNKRSPNQVTLVDLKYYVSPPDKKDPIWCVGALALHLPHRSYQDLFKLQSPTHLFECKSVEKKGDGQLRYPELGKFQKNQTELHSKSTLTVKFNFDNKTSSDEQKESTDAPMDALESSQNIFQEEDNDLAQLEEMEELRLDNINEEIIETDEKTLNNYKDLYEYQNLKKWNGCVTLCSPMFKNEAQTFPSTNDFSNSSEIAKTVSEHLDLMETLKQGKNPDYSTRYDETEEIIEAHGSDRLKAASYFLSSCIAQCKTRTQRNALERISSYIKQMFYDKYSVEQEKENMLLPLVIVMGIPGAGKSWVVSKIRKWISIILDKDNFPAHSLENSLLLNAKADSVTQEVASILRSTEDGEFGRVAVIALSGAAAGNVKGYTIHSALNFPITLRRTVAAGLESLPSLSESSRMSLLKNWSGVKVLIIDEVYTVAAHWISLIDERLRQVFQTDIPFGGLLVILVGDPRQIIPVFGQPLYFFTKFFPEQKDSEKMQHIKMQKRCKELSKRDEQGLLLYSKASLYVTLTEQIRIEDNPFAKLLKRTAEYEVDSDTVIKINELVKKRSDLLQSPWIDSIWMYPTWNEVNNHLNVVTRYMAQTKGIYRLWSVIETSPSIPEIHAKKAMEIFYTTPVRITSSWVCPLPYIDLFPGQIVALKKNWNPLWGLYNNAKAVVVGVLNRSGGSKQGSSRSLEDAVNDCIEAKSPKDEVLVKPIIPFTGKSALPDIPGIICVPWCSVRKKVNGVTLTISGPSVYPSNAISIHQSQGSTFLRAVASVNENCRKYGIANVALSRVPNPSNLALEKHVNINVLQPQPNISSFVEKEYWRVNMLSQI